MRVAQTIGERSICSRDQVGAVIVSRDNRLIDTGYNGPPRGMYQPTGRCINWCPRAAKGVTLQMGLDPAHDDCFSLHAEQNALMFSDRRVREGGKIYVSSLVCGMCAKLIANSGLIEVIVREREGIDTTHRDPTKWMEFMEQCGLTVVVLL